MLKRIGLIYLLIFSRFVFSSDSDFERQQTLTEYLQSLPFLLSFSDSDDEDHNDDLKLVSSYDVSSFFQSHDKGFSCDMRCAFSSPAMKGSSLGLPNLGNTCYLNASTVLFAVTKLNELTGSFSRVPNFPQDARKTLKHLELKSTLNQLVLGMLNKISEGHYKRSRDYVELLDGLLSDKLEGSVKRQHDPVEFLGHLLEALDSEQNRAELRIAEMTRNNRNDEVTKSVRNQKFFPLSLTEGKDLQEILNLHLEDEVISFTPDGPSREEIVYTKQRAVVFAPKTILFQLGRFTSLRGDTKYTKRIHIPQTLLVTRHIRQDDGVSPSGRVKHMPYRLKSVVTHRGRSIHSGHYVAYSFHRYKKQTRVVLYDDDRATEVLDQSFEDDIARNSYIVAYER